MLSLIIIPPLLWIQCLFYDTHSHRSFSISTADVQIRHFSFFFISTNKVQGLLVSTLCDVPALVKCSDPECSDADLNNVTTQAGIFNSLDSQSLTNEDDENFTMIFSRLSTLGNGLAFLFLSFDC